MKYGFVRIVVCRQKYVNKKTPQTWDVQETSYPPSEDKMYDPNVPPEAQKMGIGRVLPVIPRLTISIYIHLLLLIHLLYFEVINTGFVLLEQLARRHRYEQSCESPGFSLSGGKSFMNSFLALSRQSSFSAASSPSLQA